MKPTKAEILEAIRKSIEHWERAERKDSKHSFAYFDGGEYCDADNCALCKMFQIGDYENYCTDCPLFRVFGYRCANSSMNGVWHQVQFQKRDKSIILDALQYAREMVEKGK